MARWKDYTTTLRIAADFKRFLLAPIISTVIGAAAWASQKLAEFDIGYVEEILSVLVGLLVAAILFFLWVWDYAVKLRGQIRGTRVELSRLRAEGVELRNAAIAIFSTQTEFDEWKKKALEWNKRVIEEIRKINEADAEWFSILDVVSPPRIAMANQSPPQTVASMGWQGAQIKLYKEHDCRLARLGDMIRNLWRDSGEVT